MAATATAQAKPRSGMPFTILGVVFAVLGFGAVLVFSTLQGGSTRIVSGTLDQRAVVVASRDIEIRTTLSAADLRVVKISAQDVPAGAYDKIEQVKDQVAAIKLVRGQTLTSNLLSASPDLVNSVTHDYLPIPSGYVVLQIPTGEMQGAGGYIKDGDYISIIVVIQDKLGKYSNARTVYTDIHVLKVGPLTPPAAGTTPGSAKAPPTQQGVTSSLSVVVTQCQAEYLNWFLANATVRYTLESYKDYRPSDAKVDPSCATVTAAGGVTITQVLARWPGLI
jgi:Flp pilus assembly protein CpaB